MQSEIIRLLVLGVVREDTFNCLQTKTLTKTSSPNLVLAAVWAVKVRLNWAVNAMAKRSYCPWTLKIAVLRSISSAIKASHFVTDNTVTVDLTLPWIVLLALCTLDQIVLLSEVKVVVTVFKMASTTFPEAAICGILILDVTSAFTCAAVDTVALTFGAPYWK